MFYKANKSTTRIYHYLMYALLYCFIYFIALFALFALLLGWFMVFNTQVFFFLA